MLAGMVALLPPGAATQMVSSPMLDHQHDHALAVASGGIPGGIGRALILHGQVVHRRTEDDVRRFECLRIHANLLYHQGHVAAARLYMEAAARQAIATGRDYDAAMTYIDAAILAQDEGVLDAVGDLVQRATLLSGSPRVSSSDAAVIRARIVQ
jgi:hypothetical protein